MKKFVILPCILVLLLTAACGGRTAENTPPVITAAASEAVSETPALSDMKPAFRTALWGEFNIQTGKFICAPSGAEDTAYSIEKGIAKVDFSYDGLWYEFTTPVDKSGVLRTAGGFTHKEDGPEADGPYFAGSIPVFFNKDADGAAFFANDMQKYCLYAPVCDRAKLSRLAYELVSEVNKNRYNFQTQNPLVIASKGRTITVPAHWIFSSGPNEPSADGMRLQPKEYMHLIDTVEFSRDMALTIDGKTVDIHGGSAKDEIRASCKLYDGKGKKFADGVPLINFHPSLTDLPEGIEGDVLVGLDAMLTAGEHKDGYQYIFRVTGL